MDDQQEIETVASRIPLSDIRDPEDILPEDFEPTKWDVICQRGKECFEHEGNKKLRSAIHQNAESYETSKSRQAKSIIVSGIVLSIRKPAEQAGGGFIRKDFLTKRWFRVGDKLARDKVGQALRDAIKARRAVEKRNQSKDPKMEAASKSKKRAKHRFIETDNHIVNTPRVLLRGTPDPHGSSAGSFTQSTDRGQHSGLPIPHGNSTRSSSVLALLRMEVAIAAGNPARRRSDMITRRLSGSAFLDHQGYCDQLSDELEPTPIQQQHQHQQQLHSAAAELPDLFDGGVLINTLSESTSSHLQRLHRNEDTNMSMAAIKYIMNGSSVDGTSTSSSISTGEHVDWTTTTLCRQSIYEQRVIPTFIESRGFSMERRPGLQIAPGVISKTANDTCIENLRGESPVDNPAASPITGDAISGGRRFSGGPGM